MKISYITVLDLEKYLVKSNGPGKNTWLTRYFFRSSPVLELVPDIRYFINKNQKAFNFYGLDLINQVLFPGIFTW